jgi:signal transduction histidine kinase/ActR/RegA family two-component response regulator
MNAPTFSTFPAPDAACLTGDADDPAPVNLPALQTHLHALESEVATLRSQAEERAALQEMLERLRAANQSLVLATITAQTLREEAEDTNRRQNEFLAMLAHELRNPLAPISMAASLLEKIPDASPQLLRLQEIIGRQVGHMSRLLDDLLDAARISSGKISLQTRPVALAEIVTQALETVTPRIDGRHQTLSISLPEQAVMLDGDPVRLAQVFSNLLGNASKFTEDHGHIRLQATLQALPGPARVVIRVEDDGVGIPAEVMPHIFDLFTQGPRSLARSEGGLGVGLNVVRNLVGMHGGDVAVDSRGPGLGSAFIVTLPVSSQQAAEPHQESIPAGATARRILLIEDNPDACETLKSFLALEGHDVHTATDGQTGLTMASEEHFDVLLCDIGLPGINGYDVVSELRRRRADASSMPFSIALSGYGQADDRSRATDAGFDRYFVKPVEGTALLSVLSSIGQQH